MQVFVKTLSGKHLVLDVESSSLVEDVLAQVQNMTPVSIDGLCLANGSEILASDASLENCGVSSETALQLFECDEGGKKKKRKKKTFVSKKRVPHTRKKDKLKALKLFKIAKDGSVEPTHKECPNCKGSFLAKHKDGRLYCGCCHSPAQQ